MRRKQQTAAAIPSEYQQDETATTDPCPSTRTAFVAPRLPEPCFRRSTPFALARRCTQTGIEPEKYDDQRAPTSGCIHVIARLPAHHDVQRVPRESLRFAEAVVQIPDVVLLHEIGMVAEDRDGRRRGLDLRRVVELDLDARPPAAAAGARAALRASSFTSDVEMRLPRSSSTRAERVENLRHALTRHAPT